MYHIMTTSPYIDNRKFEVLMPCSSVAYSYVSDFRFSCVHWYLVAKLIFSFLISIVVILVQCFPTFLRHRLIFRQVQIFMDSRDYDYKNNTNTSFRKFGLSPTFTNFNENRVSQFVSQVSQNKGLWSSMHTWHHPPVEVGCSAWFKK